MPRNIEIKARVADMAGLRRLVVAVADAWSFPEYTHEILTSEQVSHLPRNGLSFDGGTVMVGV
jgi:hypothetical protein